MTRLEKQQLERANIQKLEEFFANIPGPRYSFHSYSPVNPNIADSTFILEALPAISRACSIAYLAGGWINRVTITTIGDQTRLEIASYHPKTPEKVTQLVLIRHECEEGLEDQSECSYCDSLYWIGAKRAEAQAEDGHGFYSGAA